MKKNRLFALFAALLMALSMQGCGKSVDTREAAAALAIFNETEQTQATQNPSVEITEQASAQETEPNEADHDEPEEIYEEYKDEQELVGEQETEEEYQEDYEGNVCYLSISCETILDNYNLCDPDKWEIVPDDGVILRQTEVTFTPGETVFDVLQRVCRDCRIHMESEWTPMYNSAYIEGIYNLYEFDVGEGSGWMYQVNGWFPNYGCSRYVVEDGDNIQWQYTCDLGQDIGGGNALG